jgi:hypothetical protein
VGPSWYVDETYIRVRGQWRYLYRAIDRDGALVDGVLSEHRDLAATKAFFRCARTVTGATPDRVTTVYPYLPRRPRGDHLGLDIPGPAHRGNVMSDTPQMLLAHHQKALKLPTFLREYDKLARQCAADVVDHVRYLLRLAELELTERKRRTVWRRIKELPAPCCARLGAGRLPEGPLGRLHHGGRSGPRTDRGAMRSDCCGCNASLPATSC